MSHRSWSAAVGLAALLAAGSARAEGAHDAAAAETLFREGRRLLEEKRYAEACPKLDESYRLDPGTGTLLASAFCHESEGKLASAWAAYVEAAARAKAEKSADREKAARQKAAELEPRLSRLTISLAPETRAAPGLAVLRDGTPVGEGSLGTALPADGGDHTIEVRATGKTPYTTVVRLGRDGDAKTVSVGTLADAAAPGPRPRRPRP